MRRDNLSGNHRKHTKPERDMGNDRHANAFDYIGPHIGPAKPYGWCQSNGVAHAYEAGPTLLSEPPTQTRVCANCGWRQFKRPSVWTDN